MYLAHHELESVFIIIIIVIVIVYRWQCRVDLLVYLVSIDMIVSQSIAELDLHMCSVTDDGPFVKLAYECQLALQEALGTQAAEKQQAIGRLQEQVDHLQDQVARAQNAPNLAQVHT